MISEVAIRLGHARSLAGVVHFPSSGLPRAAVIFLDGQDGSKVGPQRMFVHAARDLAEKGIVSLRLDTRCRGDSVGRSRDLTYGGSVEDLDTAVGFVKDELKIDRIGVCGACFGGRVALSRANDPRVRAILCCSVIRPPETTFRKRVGIWMMYARRLFSRKTWRKVFSWRVDVKTILRTLGGKKALAGNPLRDIVQTPPPAGSRITFLYGAFDGPGVEGFRFYKSLLEKQRVPFAFREIREMHHSVSSEEARLTLRAIISEWGLALGGEERGFGKEKMPRSDG